MPVLSSPIRLQEYGVGIFDHAMTKSALKKILKKNCITVNGATATSATYIKGGENLCLTLKDNHKPTKKLIYPLDVLFQDDYLAVIHKPAGIMVSGNSFKTIAHALIDNLEKSNLQDATTPQPVHRLDFATTGILLAGKTSSSIRTLNKMFENREIEKTYFAITIGEMKNEGSITSEIDAKESRTDYILCASVPSERFGKLNLVKLSLDSGRRHQLRKHLYSIGNPILGDKEYGFENLILNGKGLYLHAYSLKFIHPFTQKEIFIIDNFPKSFKKIFPEMNSSKFFKI